MLLLILSGAQCQFQRDFLARTRLPAPFEKSPYGPMNLCKGVNRNTCEINVPECRRPADPYIERESVYLRGIFASRRGQRLNPRVARNQGRRSRANFSRRCSKLNGRQAGAPAPIL